MGKAAPADAGGAPERKPPRLSWLRKPLLLTLVGIALTGWLLPAFTRQWDDRQRRMNSAPRSWRRWRRRRVTPLTANQAALFRTPRTSTTKPSLEWSRASLVIEARLDAYFSDDLVDKWRAYSDLVSKSLGVIVAPALPFYTAFRSTADEARRLRAIEEGPPYAAATKGLYVLDIAVGSAVAWSHSHAWPQGRLLPNTSPSSADCLHCNSKSRPMSSEHLRPGTARPGVT
jgi:hypothetical protein